MLYLSFSVIHYENVMIQRRIYLDIVSIHISRLSKLLKLSVFMKALPL